MRLEKWLHSGCGKSRAPPSSNGCICRLGEPACERRLYISRSHGDANFVPTVATDEEARPLSLPVTLDHQTLAPHYNGYTGRTSGAGGFDDRERSAILLRDAPGAPISTRGTVETSQNAGYVRQATSRSTSPISHAPSHNQPTTPAPSAPSMRRHLSTPFQCSACLNSLRPNYQASSTLDTPTTFFPPVGSTARTGPQGSPPPPPSFGLPSEVAASKELGVPFGGMGGLEAFRDEPMDLDFLFLFPRDFDETHASTANSQQERFPGLVLSDFDVDVDVDPTIYGNINEEATSLSTELNLRSISEEWMSGLRASVSSV